MSLLAARILVFSTSAAVLVLEILAGRLLAPYVGVTLETFTAIIGTVLAGISVGSWLGGRAADRRPPHRLLGPLLIVGGALSLLAPTIVEAVGPDLRGGGPVDIVALTALAFFAPALVLSAVTPVVVKIRLQSLAETGSVVGEFSAVGTAGAIFGTFFTGFVLLAALPSRPIVLAVGLALVGAGVVLAIRASALAPPGLLATGVGTLLAAALVLTVGGPCQVETAYYCARVTADEARPTGRVLLLDTLRHSYVDLADPTWLEFRYIKVFAEVINSQAPPGPLAVLSIGGGGFTVPRWLSAVRPRSTNTVLELDPELIDLSVAQLGLDPAEIDRIETGDARLTLGRTPERAFDVAVGDAFGGLAVPWHLTTREFLEEVRSRLTADGIYVMNVIDQPPQRFARAEAATLVEVFDQVMAVAPSGYFAGQEGGNFVLVASDAPLDPAALAGEIGRRRGREVVRTGQELEAWIGEARPLTDDFAPVDQLITRR